MTATAPFLHGLASGDPTTDSVLLWTCITTDGADPVPVSWVLADDAELTNVLASGTAEASADHDWTVHVDVGGLEPGRHYWYRFEALGAQTVIGRTKTLPPADVTEFKVATVSCAKFNAGYFNAYARLAERDEIDAIIHLGDYIYEMGDTPAKGQTPGADIGRPFDPVNECVTLTDYRTRYRQYRLDPDVQAVHAKHPIIATIDDHELADGAWRDGADNHDESKWGPWSERRASAFQARWEWHAARMPDPADPERVFRSVHFGNLAELFLIDTRSRRDKPVPGVTNQDPDRTAMGPAQKAWLFDALRSSDARWRLFGNPSILNRTYSPDVPMELREPLVKLKLLAPSGEACDHDQWDGFPAERRELLQVLGDLPERNTVVLSGDIHVGLATEVHEDPFDSSDDPVAVEAVTTSITSQNLDDKMGWARNTESRAIEAALVEYFPHWEWCELDSHGYTVVTVTPNDVTVDWWFVDTVLERTANEENAHRMVVHHGDPNWYPLDVTSG